MAVASGFQAGRGVQSVISLSGQGPSSEGAWEGCRARETLCTTARGGGTLLLPGVQRDSPQLVDNHGKGCTERGSAERPSCQLRLW